MLLRQIVLTVYFKSAVYFVLDIVLNTEQSKETLLVHVSKENYPFYKCMVISFNNLKHVQDELQIITKPEVF